MSKIKKENNGIFSSMDVWNSDSYDTKLHHSHDEELFLSNSDGFQDHEVDEACKGSTVTEYNPGKSTHGVDFSVPSDGCAYDYHEKLLSFMQDESDDSTDLGDIHEQAIKSEQALINDFFQKIKEVYNNKTEAKEILKNIQDTINKYLEKGIRLNICHNDSNQYYRVTVAEFIFQEMEYVLNFYNDRIRSDGEHMCVGNACELEDDVIKIMQDIARELCLKGGKVKRDNFYSDKLYYSMTRFSGKGNTFNCNLDKDYKKIKDTMESIACKAIRNNQDKLKIVMDNKHLFIKCSLGSIVESALIMNNQEMNDLAKGLEINLETKSCVLQIGKSSVRIEKAGEKRNYTDISGAGIEISFYTEVGDVSIRLYPGKNEIKVKIDEKNKMMFEKLKDKSVLGKNSLLGGRSVLEAIKHESFKRSCGINETNESISPTFMEQEVNKKPMQEYTTRQSKEKPYPDNFYQGNAIPNGSCFFDSLAQGLKQIKPDIEVDYQYLRQVCKKYAESEPPSQWFMSAIANIHDNNGKHAEVMEQYLDNILQDSRWGDPEVEGRVLCEYASIKLDIDLKLHLVEYNKDHNLFIHHIIDRNGSKSCDASNLDYNDDNTLHIINMGNNHFEPLLDINKQRIRDKKLLPSCVMEDAQAVLHTWENNQTPIIECR